MTDRLPPMVAVAIATFVTPARARAGLRLAPGTWTYTTWDELKEADQAESARTAEELEAHGWRSVDLTDAAYPTRLAALQSPPPVLFYRGDIEILDRPAIGMCGARKASAAGLRAARACATVAAQAGLVVVSGNAAGVDSEAHLGALEGGSSTVLVIPEGALHYRARRSDALGDVDDRVLVVSQFAPRQPWLVGSAMARNTLIAGLGEALVVIEAGSEGGTLNAGKQALRMGRPVIALEFESVPTPPGNAILHAQGATRLRRPSDLPDVLAALPGIPHHDAQLGLALG